MRRWMLNGGIIVACLWVIYVFLHIGQIRVWQQFRASRIFGFRYSVTTPREASVRFTRHSSSGAMMNTTPDRFKSLMDLPGVKFEPYKPNTKFCSPKDLGPIKTPFTIKDLPGEITNRVLDVLGGVWRPKDCVPMDRVAVIIPYRNRSNNLALVTTHLNYFLQQQQIEYGIFIIEQADTKRFNRAKLLNIGFTFVSKRYPQFECFVFHDADKLPLDTRHSYKCDARRPRHMISRMRSPKSTKFRKGMLYSFFFGGVTAMTKSQFSKVNGMSNGYWGWGREDDDLSARLRLRGLVPVYTHSTIASYLNIAHKSDVIPNKNPWPHQHVVRKMMDKDGLGSLKFKIKSHQRERFFTKLSVFL